MTDEKIQRINELYKKSKTFKRNLRGQLDNISIQELDGSITNLGEKYGNKKGH